jgi:hypothetical protein
MKDLDKWRNTKGEIWLNVASSSCVLPDFVNVDNSLFFRLQPIYPLIAPFLSKSKVATFHEYKQARRNGTLLIHDCRRPLPFPDESIDHILCSHFLEHVYPDEATGILKDFYRSLKRQGTVHIIVPDLRYFVDTYLSAKTADSTDSLVRSTLLSFETRPSFRHRFLEFLGYEGMRHRWMYDQESMAQRLSGVGFQLLQDNNSPSSCFRREDGPVSVHLLGIK